MKISFKKDPTGWSSTESVTVKESGIPIGALTSPVYKDKWKLSLQIQKNGKDVIDSNPNCSWKWVFFKKEWDSLENAKEEVKLAIPKILDKNEWSLYYES